MKKYVYPAILFESEEENVKVYNIFFPDLDIVSSGETVEEAFLGAEDYLQAYLKIAVKMESQIPAPSTFEETEKMNPKRYILLASGEVEDIYQLTPDEEKYKNFVKKYLVSTED